MYVTVDVRNFTWSFLSWTIPRTHKVPVRSPSFSKNHITDETCIMVNAINRR